MRTVLFRFGWLKWLLVALCGLLTTLSVHATVLLEANGVTTTYTLIDSVLGAGASDETPDCSHPAFGPHITQSWDTTLGKNAFNFYIHVTPDDDRCEAVDRQRNEIKTWDTISSGYLVAYEGDTTAYHWYFKLDAGFQPSPSFTHIHQIKGVDGSDIDLPIFTISPRTGSPDQLEILYITPKPTSETITLATADLSLFKGEWIEAYEQIKHATPGGTYKLVLKRLSDNTVLLSYTNNSLSTWRSDASWNRPKWGIYRSLLSDEYLRDETVKFADFSLAKGSDPCPATTNAAPSVSLTSPANGATFAEPASIAMTATASDTDGTIAVVNFYNGTTLLGTDTTSPYAYTWSGAMYGSYSLTAVAVDNHGLGTRSSAAAVTVTTAAPLTNTYTTAGGATWVCPANVTSVLVQCWGGGGAGGSAFRNPNSGTTEYGGGGAGGAYAKDNSYPVTPGNTYYVNVGAGGANNSTVNDTAVPGGDSWFNFINAPSTTIIAKGGAGGQSAVGNTTNTAFGTGGTGTTAGSIGDVVYAGGSGATTPSVSPVYGGAGGGSGGTASAGNSAVPNSGTGAAAVTGGGNGGNPNPVSGSSGSGQTPTIPPGGGGGGGRDGAGTLKAGGTGCVGRVVLVYVASGGGSGNTAPVFTADPISKAGATEDVSYTGQTLAGSATDADGDTLSYSVQAGPAWLSIASNGALSGTPANADVGVNSWSVQVSDGNGGTDTAILNITVANVNDAPVFTVDPMSRANASVGVAYSQTISGSATDVDAGATLTYSKVSGPTWLSIATSGALTGTPASGDAGANSWTVQVSDGLGGTDTAVLNITVNLPSAPTFVAAGAVAGGTGTIAPALPAGLATGDILLLFVETANQACSISSANGGTWAAVAASPQGTGTAGGTAATMLTAFWSRYNGTQGAPTVSDSGDHTIGRMIAVRGAAAAGDPWNVTAGGVEATSDTSGSIPGATTTVDNTLVVTAVAASLPDATSTAIFSGWANANLTSLTERIDNANKSNNGGALGVATGVKATAGAYGNTTVTHSSAAVKGMMSIAIKN